MSSSKSKTKKTPLRKSDLAKLAMELNLSDMSSSKSKTKKPPLRKSDLAKLPIEYSSDMSSSKSRAQRTLAKQLRTIVNKSTRGKKTTKGKKTMKKLNKDILENVPFCKCSPFFTDEFVEKMRKSKKIKHFVDKIELQNRAAFQKELYDEKDINKKNTIIEQFDTLCNDNKILTKIGKDYINELITDTSDKTDILIMKQNKKVLGVAIVGKSSSQDTYTLELICSGSVVKNGGSFLLMMYLLALKYNNLTIGSLQVASGYENMNALCLYDKFGFREDVSLIKLYKVLMMKTDLKNTTTVQIKNTFLNNVNKIKKTEPLCSDDFKKLNESVRNGLIRQRNYNLKNINSENDVTNLRKKNKEEIDFYINEESEWERLKNQSLSEKTLVDSHKEDQNLNEAADQHDVYVSPNPTLQPTMFPAYNEQANVHDK
jgi:hypothetical protein